MELKGSFLQWPADRPLLSRAIAAFLGVLFTAGFAPLGLSLLVTVALVPLLYVFNTAAPRDAAAHGFWFGVGAFLSGTYWIYISVVGFGGAPWYTAVLLLFVLVTIMAIYLAIAGWLIARLSYGEPWLLLAVAPAAWVLIEWLRGWLFTGFPWLAVGYAQSDSWFAGWAPVLGVYGVSFMVLLSATALLVALLSKGKQRGIAVAAVVLPFLLGGVLTRVEWTETAGPPLKATLIQYGISQDQKWLPEMLEPTLGFYRRETLQARDSDIVLWPEVAIPSANDLMQPYISALEGDARAAGQSIVFGILEREQDRGEVRTYNAMFLVDGDKRQSYRKRHLVPYGEYFPVPQFIRDRFDMEYIPRTDLVPGAPEQELLLHGEDTPLAVAICYEDAYGAEQLYALPEARLLINVSNDAWFGDSIAPMQHLQIARMRSIEAGRESLRATSTGISAFIGHRGELLETGAQFEPVVLTRSVQPRSGATPYVQVGNSLIVGICLLLLAAAWLRVRGGF
ncbi:MAG: apolipoprotein N-acyltransferase [Pseudomonadota bacterium]